jgi:type IV fimbrial biogenesis protein FimT
MHLLKELRVMNILVASQRARRTSGMTIVESCVVLAVASICIGLAVPSFEQAIEKRHLEGVAAQLETDLQFGRSLAVARNESVRIAFESDSAGSCYVLHTGAAGACTCGPDGQAVCSEGSLPLRAVRFGADFPVRVSSNAPSMLFDASKGTVSPTGTMQVQSRHGKTVKLIVNIMGRIRSCSPSGQVSGYKPC